MSKRVNVMFSDEMNLKLDKYSERYGVSKSAIVGFVVGQWMDQMDKINNTVYGVSGKDGLIAEILNEVANQNNESQKES